MRLRREVRRFAEDMERQLRANDAKRGDEWTRMTPRALRGRLREELAEFRWALRADDDWGDIRNEGVDCANFIMFITEVLGRRPMK